MSDNNIHRKIMEGISVLGKITIPKEEVKQLEDGLYNFCVINDLTFVINSDQSYTFSKLNNICTTCD